MSLLKTYSYTSGAGETKTLPGGRFFRLMTASAPVDVEFFADNGSSFGVASQVLAGFAVKFAPRDINRDSPLVSFGSVKITSATAQSIQAAISRQEVDYDRSAGTVDLVKAGTITTTTDVALGAGAKTAVLVANAARRYALITNMDAATIFRIGDAANVAAARGTPLSPGETIKLETTAAISAWNPGGASTVAVLEVAD